MKTPPITRQQLVASIEAHAAYHQPIGAKPRWLLTQLAADGWFQLHDLDDAALKDIGERLDMAFPQPQASS